MKSTISVALCSSAVIAVLAMCVTGCAATVDVEDGVTSDSALTAGALDTTLGTQGRVDGNETYLGERGASLLFFGQDAQGPYVARRSRKLELDAAFGANGRAYFDLTNVVDGRIDDAALLPDGRVVGVGGKYGGKTEYVLNGVKVKTTAMVVIVVSADGKQQKRTSYDRLATKPYPDYDQGYRAYTLEGTAVTTLSDGRIAVGAGIGLYDSNNGQARLYAFSVNGLDATFDTELWSAEKRSIYGTTQNHGVPTVVKVLEAGPGSLLVGTDGFVAKPGDEWSRSSDASYVSVAPKAGATAAESEVFGVAEQYARTVATRLPDGRALLAGHNTYACPKTIALARLSPALVPESGFGNSTKRPNLHCVAGATGMDSVTTVSALAADATRAYVVTTSNGNQSTVWALNASGDVDASFGAAGEVAVPGNASAAFVSGGYLYVQLWDSYSYLPGSAGARDTGYFRRIKL